MPVQFVHAEGRDEGGESEREPRRQHVRDGDGRDRDRRRGDPHAAVRRRHVRPERVVDEPPARGVGDASQPVQAERDRPGDDRRRRLDERQRRGHARRESGRERRPRGDGVEQRLPERRRDGGGERLRGQHQRDGGRGAGVEPRQPLGRRPDREDERGRERDERRGRERAGDVRDEGGLRRARRRPEPTDGPPGRIVRRRERRPPLAAAVAGRAVERDRDDRHRQPRGDGAREQHRRGDRESVRRHRHGEREGQRAGAGEADGRRRRGRPCERPVGPDRRPERAAAGVDAGRPPDDHERRREQHPRPRGDDAPVRSPDPGGEQPHQQSEGGHERERGDRGERPAEGGVVRRDRRVHQRDAEREDAEGPEGGRAAAERDEVGGRVPERDADGAGVADERERERRRLRTEAVERARDAGEGIAGHGSSGRGRSTIVPDSPTATGGYSPAPSVAPWSAPDARRGPAASRPA
ncbi:hypothetical protein [Halobaculum litoreum]|uniref:hypothetical protein n=1 Tax=Halobaculum litoreum TaxID=3031998 RepID=UPI0024C33E4E|nr:hypothetical protein [Halobaculum sp. DT92]